MIFQGPIEYIFGVRFVSCRVSVPPSFLVDGFSTLPVTVRCVVIKRLCKHTSIIKDKLGILIFDQSIQKDIEMKLINV